MSESVAIRERIEREVKATLEGMTGVGTVYRWTGRANINLQHLDAVVIPEEDAIEDGAQGDTGWLHKALSLMVAVVLMPDEEATENHCALRNRWQARLEQAIANNYEMTETATSKRLAVDTSFQSVDAPDIIDGALTVALRVIVHYEHPRNDPYTAPGVSALVE